MLGYMGVLTKGGAGTAPAADPRLDSSPAQRSSDGIVTIQRRPGLTENQP